MKLAILAALPATEYLPEDRVKPRYIGREHPVPWVQLLCDALADVSGLTLRCFTYTRAVRKVERVQRKGVGYVFVPKKETGYLDPFHGHWPATWRMKPLIDEFSPDVVHAHGTEYCYGTVSTRLRYPVVLSIQGVMDKLRPYDERNRIKLALMSWFEKRAVLGADAIIAKTGFAEKWVREVGFQGQVAHIPNLVDTRFLKQQATLDSNRILCVGTLNKNKNQSLLIRAFALLPNREKYRLVLVGDGSWRKRLEKLVRDLGVEEQVEFLGRVSRQGVLEEMLKARMLVCCSFMETSPNVISEAQTVGLPVIATDIGGIPCMLRDVSKSSLVDSFSADVWVVVLQDTLSGARSELRSFCNNGNIAEQSIDLYRTLI